MAEDRFHAEIKALLEKNGAMGVNAIQKELDVPLSTLQKYLDKQQNYFKKNALRKWVLPEKLVNEHMSVITDNHTDIIENQISSMKMLARTLISQFDSTMILMATNNAKSPSVAGISDKVDPSIEKLTSFVTALQKAIKEYKDNIPDIYKDLILNLDVAKLCAYKGLGYMNDEKSADITGILLGERDTMSEAIITTLKEYQK